MKAKLLKILRRNADRKVTYKVYENKGRYIVDIYWGRRKNYTIKREFFTLDEILYEMYGYFLPYSKQLFILRELEKLKWKKRLDDWQLLYKRNILYVVRSRPYNLFSF